VPGRIGTHSEASFAISVRRGVDRRRGRRALWISLSRGPGFETWRKLHFETTGFAPRMKSVPT
jgi:hypothetical protein